MSNVESLYMSESGMLLAACITKQEYYVLIVKGFIFIHDENCVGRLLLELVQGLSNVNADISDSFEIPFTGQGRVLQPCHHVSRNEKEAAFSCCAVSCGESMLEEDLGKRLEVGSTNSVCHSVHFC